MHKSVKPREGTIVVSLDGDTLVHVWPDESDTDTSFTGGSLLTGECSSLWAVDAFVYVNLFKATLLRRYMALRRAEAESAKKEDRK